MTREELEAEVEQLRQQLAGVTQTLAQRDAAVMEAAEHNRKLQEHNDQLKHHNQVLTQLVFGPKRERRADEVSAEPNALQGWLFMADLVEDAERLAEETGASTTVNAREGKKPRRRPRRRKKFPDHLPRVRTTIELPEADRVCCGQPMAEMGEELRRELERIEITLVHEIVRKKYCCRHCQETVKIAPAPVRVIDKGLLSTGFLAQVLTERFGNHMPYHRLEKKYQAEGLDLSRVVLCQSALRCAELLEPIWKQLGEEVRASPVVHTDDTPVNLQKSSQGGRRQARVWIYLDLEGRHVYDFTESRTRDGPVAFLGDFAGYIQADAYSGYDALFHAEGATEVACWSHARRYFVRAEREDAELSGQAIRRIRELFAIERAATDQELPPKQRQKLRQEHAVPRLNEFRAWLDLTETKVLPKSAMGRAIRYCLNQWDALQRYTEDGRLSMDNNAAERALRAVAVGRKNWTQIGNPRGGHGAAILYSLVMTCKAIGIDPRQYFRDVLLRIAHCSDVRKLTPHGWQEHFAAEVHDRHEHIVQVLMGSESRQPDADAA